MKSILLALALAALPLAPRAQTPALAPAALEGTATPGVAALVIRDFRAGAEQVAGLRRLGSHDAIRRGDRWSLGSDGKAMTATMIGRLVDRGLLAWDTPLSQLLPDLASTMRPEYRAVTLLDLMSHRAGLPENHADMAFFHAFYDDRRPLPEQRLAYIRAALQDPPVGPAQAKSQYSNTGFLIAAAAAERATHTSFESLMRREVFGPLHMTSVSFVQAGGPGEPQGHVDGRVADHVDDPNPAMFSPAGGLRMSLADWARFCIDQMQGERGRGRLLKPATYRRLHTAQGETSAGLGWGVQPKAIGRQGPALTHAGSDGNWYALVVLYPKVGDGVLVAANGAESMGGDKVARTVIKALAAGVSSPTP